MSGAGVLLLYADTRCLVGVHAPAAMSLSYQWGRLAELKQLPDCQPRRTELREEGLRCWRWHPGVLTTGLSLLHAALNRRTPGSDMLALTVQCCDMFRRCQFCRLGRLP